MKRLVVFLLLGMLHAWAASLSGKIRDPQGIPLAGVQVNAGSFSTTTDTQGAYHFVSLPSGEYQLETSLPGFVTSRSALVSITDADLVMDVTMSRSPAAHPQFEAAGVRGLIDPGGYSVSANAAAATGLIKGIADIQRSENASTGITPSCALEPTLKREQEAKPESDQANLKLGEFYLAHGQVAKAVALLERARSLNSADPETIEHLAEAYLRGGQFDAAGQILVPSVMQNRPEMHRLLARVDEGTGKFTLSAREYQLAAGNDPSAEDLYAVGYEFVLAGSPVDAERIFQAGIQRHPQSIQLLIGLGSAQFLQGHTSDAVQTLLHAVELDPADPRSYPFLAAASGVPSERVRAAFEQFHSLAPDDPRSSYYLALALVQTHAAGVEVLLRRAIALDPSFPDAHYQLGVLYARQGNWQAAAQELETALRLSPSLKEAHYSLAMAYRHTGHADLSAKEMQRFREAQAPSPAIDQFISVFAPPASGVPRGILCPGDTP